MIRWLKFPAHPPLCREKETAVIILKKQMFFHFLLYFIMRNEEEKKLMNKKTWKSKLRTQKLQVLSLNMELSAGD